MCSSRRIRFDRVNLSDDSKMVVPERHRHHFLLQCADLLRPGFEAPRRAAFLFQPGCPEATFSWDTPNPCSMWTIRFGWSISLGRRRTGNRTVDGRWRQKVNAKQHSQLQAQINKLDSISTAPAILQPLLDMLRLPSDKISIEKVVELVSYDGAIAAQCLRMANSPLFGTPPGRNRALRGHGSRPRESTFDPVRFVHESDHPAR